MGKDAREPDERGGAAALAPRLVCPLILALAFAALATWSRGKWTDPVVDFGTELYLPWRMVEGDVLYRDLAYRNGPLSPTINALLFRTFGVSLQTLVIANLALLALVCAIVVRIVRRAAGVVTATTAGLVLLGVFGFGQYTLFGNFNWVTPYQHAQTHGVLAALVVVLCWTEVLRRGSGAWAFVGGVALGAAFLTKAELFVPAAAVTLAGALLARSLRPVLLSAVGALVLPAVLLLSLLAEMPFAQALGGVLGNWLYLGGAVAEDAFYLRGAGLDEPGENLVTALGAALPLLLLGALAFTWDRARSRSGRGTPVWASAGIVIVAGVLGAGLPWPLTTLARGLPVVALGATLVFGAAAQRARRSAAADDFARFGALALLGVLALTLLGKTLLAARVHQYGFALAMPATVLTAVVAVWGVPELARRRHAGGALARALGLGAVAGGIAFHVAWAGRWYALYGEASVGRGADAIRVVRAEVDPRGAAVADALARIEAQVPPGATLVVLPEGVALNYWTRRPSSSRFTLFLPTEIAAVREQAMIADLEAHPPDFVALVPRDASEWGMGDFGTEERNGLGLLRWVLERYEPVDQVDPSGGDDRSDARIALLRSKAGR